MTVKESATDDTRRAELLEALAGAVGRMREAAGGTDDDQGHWRPDPDSWSVCMTVTHLARAEPLFRQRLRRMLAEENPLVPSFGPESATPSSDRPLAEALRTFAEERQKTIALLSGLAPEAWARAAVHETLGPTTIVQQVENMIDHDTAHVGQIAEVSRQWQGQRAGRGEMEGGADG